MNAIDLRAIRRAVKNRRSEIFEWTRELVTYPSENRPPDGYEGEAQNFIADECTELGFAVDTFTPGEVPNIKAHSSWLPGRNYPGDRKNVVAVWKGAGKGKSILFSGHIDVAPFEPDNWKICRPYDPVERNGRLYGRGSADMKGGMAAAFWALKILKDLGFQPEGDIFFESVVDEEFAGGNGTLASRLKGYNADLAVLTEPTCMELCPACFGGFLGDITLRGKAGMPYMGSAIPNPISGISRVIQLFAEWQELWRQQDRHPLFNEPGKELNVVLWNIDSKTPGEFTQMGIPLLTKLSWIVWCYPGMTEKEFYTEFEDFWNGHAGKDKMLAPFSLEISPAFHFVRPWETDQNHPAVRTVSETFSEYMGKKPRIGGAPFSCDLAIYGDTGAMPSVILGPSGDNLHAPDEWVLLEDIYSLAGIFALLTLNWCGK